MYKISQIYWERANIHLIFENLSDKQIYLVNKANRRIELKQINGNEVVINTTNTPEGSMLENGKWYIEIDGELAEIDDTIVMDLDDKSRIFKYREGFYSYIVEFKIDKDKKIYIDTDFMMKNRKYKKMYRLSEGKNSKKKVEIAFKIIGIHLINMLYHILHFFKINKKKKVLFYTENADNLVGNMKYLYDELKKEDLKIFVYAKNIYDHINYIGMLKAVCLMAKSDYIIVDNYTTIITMLDISRKTKIIQLWHAGIGFKAVGYARFGKEGSPHPIRSAHRKYDYMIVDDEKLINIYKEVFGNKEEKFRSFGIPRLENYLSKENIDKTVNKLFNENENLKDKKIILFSPTYRGKGAHDAYYDYSKIDLEKIYEFCKLNNFVFIIKMHPFVSEKINIPDEYKKYIYDYSKYDINELIYISDIMITDYSSCAYEYSFFNRPLIFYRYDKVIYEYLRPMHTLNAFTDKQFEVTNFEKLLETLNELKDVSIEDRFSNISKKSVENSSNIKKIILGELDD